MRTALFILSLLFSTLFLGCGETKPATPSGTTVVAGNSQNTISWSSVANSTSYNLYWSTNKGVNKSATNKITGVTSPYVHAGLTNGTTYYYVITSVDSKGESSESNEAFGTPVSGKAFVTNAANNTLSIIDTVTNQTLSTVSVGANPVAVAVNNTLNRAYTANSQADSVSVVDTINYTVLSTVNVGSKPSAIGVNTQNAKVYVANYGSNSVTIIDGNTNQLAATINVGQKPNALSVNIGSGKIYVTNSGDNTISVIDTTTNAVTQTLTVGSGAGGVVAP